MSGFLVLLNRELAVNFLDLKTLITNLIFFILSVFIFLLSFSNDIKILQSYFHCVIWVVFLFSVVFSTEQFFESDFKDGSLKELITTGYSPLDIILSKFLGVLVMILLPILIIFPILIYVIDSNYFLYKSLIKSIILGGPSIILINLIGQILLANVKKNKILLFILIVPFYIPILIFGIGATELEIIEKSPDKNFVILIGLFMITLSISLITGKLAMEELNN